MPAPEVLYLSRRDVESLALGMAEIIDLVAFSLSERGHGRTEMPPKPGVHPQPEALLHAMPAYVARARACGIKWVSSFPANKSRGLPAITGLIILNHPETGLPEAIMEASWITAWRTGAATAVAARAFARQESEVVGILGAGVQARTNVAALKQVQPHLRLVRVYGQHRESLDRYKESVEREHNLSVELAQTPERAIKETDIVVTTTPWPRRESAPPIRPEWLSPGVFACALDFDASFTAEAFSVCDRRVSDDVATMAFYRERGYFSGWSEATELAAVIAGAQPGRTHKEERIISVNLGLAIYDVVVAGRLLERARQRKIGTLLPL